METGTIRWFNTERGYGFITPDNGGKDIFVHVKQIAGGECPAEGQRVRYDKQEDAKGRLEAKGVELISGNRGA